MVKVVRTRACSCASSSASTRAGARGGAFDVSILDDRPGCITFEVSGPGAREAFAHEAGGHRWQRISPTEKRGRVHSSSVTVAVLPVPTETEVRIDERDLEWRTCRSGGKGGQGVNTTDSAVQLAHRPSGIAVRVESERSQQQNRRSALALLRSKLAEAARAGADAARAEDRRAQLGLGMRGCKIRTVGMQRGEVVDHVLGRRMRVKDYLDGKLEGLVVG